MDIKQLLETLDMLKISLNEMGKFYTNLSFPEFRLECLKRYKLKQLNEPYEYSDTALVTKINNVDIYDRCIEHVNIDHPNMDNDIWLEFLNTFNPKTDIKEKAKYDGKQGKRYVYKCKSNRHAFGYVLDIIKNKYPRLVTAFFDHTNSVDNWFNNVVNGQAKV